MTRARLCLGHLFDRRLPEPVEWLEAAMAPGAEPNLDLWATPTSCAS